MASPACRRRTNRGTEANVTPVQEPSDSRDWSELPLDALTSVFAKLGAMEILMGAGLVCQSWLQAAKMPDVWRVVKFVDTARHKAVVEGLENSPVFPYLEPQIDFDVLCAMAKVAVDRSGGQLQVFIGKRFVTNELLEYVADRSPSLKGLNLTSCNGVYNEDFIKTVAKFPVLEDLVLVLCNNLSGCDVYEAIGKACTQLKRFWMRKDGWPSANEEGEARGIAAMHELRSLTLTSCNLTNDDLEVILGSCSHLEILSLNSCYNIVVDDALQKKCARIKTMTLPVFHQTDEDDYETFCATDCARDFDWDSD